MSGSRRMRVALAGTGSVFLGLLLATLASAAVLVVDSGQLMGARGVIVGGLSYDVDFVDGTCVDLYDGCDEESDFTFNWMDSATTLAARAALLDQVFIGIYDSEPELTNGCTAESWCSVNFPIQKLGSPTGIGVAVTTNDEDEPQDNATGQGGGSNLHDTTNVNSQTYAVWSGPNAVPTVPISPLVPVAVALASIGLARVRVSRAGAAPRFGHGVERGG